MSSVRVHISLMTRPVAFEMRAASSGPSQKSLRPNDPPLCTTWQVTLFCGSPSSFAICCCATIGDFMPAQMSAPSSRTSATAEFVSIGAWGRNAQSNSNSCWPGSVTGGMNGIVAWRSSLRMSSSDRSSIGPGPQVTSRASLASSAWPNVSATTATPVLITAMSRTPGMARTSSRLLTFLTVPLIVGGRRTIAGVAPLMSRSRVYLKEPVTISRASTRRCDVPTRVNSDGDFGAHHEVGHRQPRGERGELAVAEAAPVVGVDPAALRAQAVRGQSPAVGRGPPQSRAGRSGGGAHRPVHRADRVGTAGELVEHQLRAGRRQWHVDGVEREVELLGHQHRHGRGEALAHLHARQRDNAPGRSRGSRP